MRVHRNDLVYEIRNVVTDPPLQAFIDNYLAQNDK